MLIDLRTGKRITELSPAEFIRSVRCSILSAHEGLIDWSHARESIRDNAGLLWAWLVPWLLTLAEFAGMLFVLASLALIAVGYVPDLKP